MKAKTTRMITLLIVFILVLIPVTIQSAAAPAATPATPQAKPTPRTLTARLLTPVSATQRIQGLRWLARSLPLTIERSPHRHAITVQLPGQFTRPEWTLVGPDGSMFRAQPNNGRFSMRIPLTKRQTRIIFFSINIRGQVEREKIVIQVDKAGWLLAMKEARMPARRFSLSAGIGTTYLNYWERLNGILLNELAITPKASASYLLAPPSIDIGGNVFTNLLVLAHGPASLNPARFLGVNGRIGLRLPMVAMRAEWKFLFGWYLWTMRTEGRLYGLDILSGPQLFLTVAKGGENRRPWFGYFKFAPVASGFDFDITNREVAVGGGYQLSPPGAAWPLTLTLDISDLRFESEEQWNGMRLNSVTLGVSTGI